MGLFDTPTGAVIAQGLNLSRRQELVTANNLANYDTPGYKAVSFRFQTALRQALSGGPGAIMAVSGTTVVDRGSLRPDGNSVSMTQEMATLTQAQLLYETSVQALNQKVTDLKIVTGGKPL